MAGQRVRIVPDGCVYMSQTAEGARRSLKSHNTFLTIRKEENFVEKQTELLRLVCSKPELFPSQDM